MDKEKTILAPKTILLGRYSIVGRLGRGGMGVVYDALDMNLGCRVAIKETFATDAEADLRWAFEHEAQLLANVHHPAFPRVTDYFEQGDRLFFVMHFIKGHDLEEELMMRGRPFEVTEVLRWADTLLDALAVLHGENPPIVHKDIKPSNIKRADGRSVVKRRADEIYLVDFGLAKGALGQMGTVPGDNYSHLQGHTPHFASPEQKDCAGTSPRSDLYSLAATLWCLLTNQYPPDSGFRSNAVNNGNPDPLRPAHELNSKVPPAVSAILEQAMSLSQSRRPPSAAAMRVALREAIEAPLRARAERERAAEEARVRREGETAGRLAAEEEFGRQLEEDRATHLAAVRRLEEEHADALTLAQAELKHALDELSKAQASAAEQKEVAHRLDLELDSARKAQARAESELLQEQEQQLDWEKEYSNLEANWERQYFELEDRWEKSKAELQSVRHTLDGERLSEKERQKQTDETLSQMASTLASKDAALRETEEKIRTLVAEKDSTIQRVKQSERMALTLEHRVALLRSEAAESRRGLRAFKNVPTIAALFLGAALWAGLSWATSPASVTRDTVRLEVGGVYFEMVKVRGGTFLMGSPDADAARMATERPLHQVTVPDFNIGRYEVTQAQWRAVAKLPKVQLDLKEDVSFHKGDDLESYDLPVESVSWAEAVEFCARLSKATGLKYRLPTEAEWEYAARGGEAVAGAADSDPLGWSAGNSGKQKLDVIQLRNSINRDPVQYSNKLKEYGCQTHPVGQKRANAFGLYDTLGNVWEWCSDTWHDDYKGAPNDGTGWADEGNSTSRVQRGGSWYDSPGTLHPADRSYDKSDGRFSNVGFRIVRSP